MMMMMPGQMQGQMQNANQPMMMQMPMQNGMQMQQGGMQQGGMQMQPVVWAQPNNGMNNGTNGTSNGMANSKQTQGSSGGGFAGPPGAFSGPPGTLIPSTQKSSEPRSPASEGKDSVKDAPSQQGKAAKETKENVTSPTNSAFQKRRWKLGENCSRNTPVKLLQDCEGVVQEEMISLQHNFVTQLSAL